MKVCTSCGKVVLDIVKSCDCGNEEFQAFLIPFFDSVEEYLEVGNGKEVDSQSHKKTRSFNKEG